MMAAPTAIGAVNALVANLNGCKAIFGSTFALGI